MVIETWMTLRRLAGRIAGWSVGLFMYIVLMVSMYESVAAMGDLTALYDAFPEEMLGFFRGITELNTPQGYLDTYYYNYVSVIIGLLAVGIGAGLLVGDEERGLMDIVLAHPISRSALYWGRVAGMVLALALIAVAGWLGWVLPPQSADIGLTPLEMLLPSVPLITQLLLFGALALFFSMVLPASRSAGMLTGMLLVGNYLLTGLANINPDLEAYVRYTPLHYYEGGYAVLGVNWTSIAGLLSAAAVLFVAAWVLFVRRDIRVGGEHSWQWRAWRRPRAANGPVSQT